jgi:type IV pilus assembly protein PilE
MARKGQRGFTLIELMIVVLVIAVLAGIALSGYQKQIRKSRRAEARQVIADLALKQEKYRANNPTYGTVAQIGGAATTSYYTVALAGSATGTAYTFTATPVGDQAKDSCGVLTWAMSAGTVTKTPDPTNCW